MAESDSSSEMSDGALQNLVATLVKAGEEIEESEMGDVGESPKESLNHEASSTLYEHMAHSGSVESAGDEELVQAAVTTNNSVWPSFALDGPSPVPLHRKDSSRSPQSESLDREAGLLASAEVSDVSSEGGQVEAPLAVTVAVADSTGEDAEADSCGYEGDVGESTKLPPSLRRPADVVVVAPTGQVSSKDGGDEADDEGTGKSVNKSLLHHQPTSFALDTMARESLSMFGRSSSSICRPGGSNENSPWEALNEALREQGFHEVPLSRHVGGTVVPDLSSVAPLFRDVLSQHGERGKIIQDMSFEVSKHQMTGYRDQAQNESFRRQKIDLSRRCTEAEARAMEVEEEKERLRERFAKENRRLKMENANLASQLKQSEHRVKSKEAATQILMDKLRNEAEKERVSRQREREMLNIQQKKGGGGWAKNSEANESFIANQRARERTEAEMDFLQAEVSRLNEELREKENTLLRHHLGADSHNDDSSDELQVLRDRLAESERIGRIMRQREARAFERCKEMEEHSRAIQTKLDETQESLVNAQMEISSRPSLRNWRASQRRVQDLETKLAKATSQAKEAMDVAELRRWVDTRELMRRDRGNHRLKLDRLDELPSMVMKQVLQDACRLLALQDVSLLAPSVAKLTKAVQMLPRLERFVNSVCAFVFRNSSEVLSGSGSGSLTQVLGDRTKTMEDVLPLLELWLARAREPINLKEFRQGVLMILESRTHQSQAKGTSDPQRKSDHAALTEIQHLVKLEQRSLEELELNNQAELSLNDDPELPVNRIVKHFQLLFGVKSIGGCTAKLNEIYRFSSGMQTFLRTAGDLLDMSGASHEAVIRQLTTVLETRHDVNPDARLRFSHDASSWSETPSVDETVGGRSAEALGQRGV